MSSELHKYIETAIEKKQTLLNAEVINFPNDKKADEFENFKKKKHDFWKINDKTNDDQLKAVVGICLMFGSLMLIGLYSNLL
jgi:hypothetical protein|tara:strand:+ start:586 stop:831 length:246 start_codon:yes stop_codon:yes gene_type:complete